MGFFRNGASVFGQRSYWLSRLACANKMLMTYIVEYKLNACSILFFFEGGNLLKWKRTKLQ
jgi:hypothetical protein